MSWGANFFYYHCPVCKEKFKYAQDLIPEFGERFGCCPKCGAPGVFEKDSPRIPEDSQYFEVEDY